MKKLIYIILAAAIFAACEPIEDREVLSGAIGVNDLDLTATPVQVNGLNSNEIIVENNSPILSRWISDRTKIEKAYGTVIFDYTGSKEVQFIGLNADGSKVETTIPVSVDTITNILDTFVGRLGIKYNEDGSPDQSSLPYYLSMALRSLCCWRK